MAERKLTERQRAFCRRCAAGTVPKEAARQAGYQDFASTARKLMRMDKIQAEIATLRKEEKKPPEKETKAVKEEKAVAEKEEILCFLTEVLREEDDPRMRMKAAELLGRRESLFEREKKPEEGNHVFIVDDLP